MYLRHTIRKKDGKVHRYWCLVRSVRIGRRVIQQTVAHLGELDEHGRVEARALARRLIGTPEQAPLFDHGSEHLTVPVRLKSVRVERSRQFGDVYLALALWRGTGLRICVSGCADWKGAHCMGEDGCVYRELTENSVRIDYVTELPNVSGDDRSVLPLPGAVRLTVQVEEPT